MEQPPNSEASRPAIVYERIKAIHEDFLKKVPGYDRKVWSPAEAIKLGRGGCMAELLYVAGSLLYYKNFDENDLSIRIYKDHGKRVYGQAKADIKHVVLMLNIDGNIQECGFRENSVREGPQYRKLSKDDSVFNDENIEIYTFGDGIYEYIHRLGGSSENIPTVAELISLHNPEGRTIESFQVRFDEDF